MGKTQTEKPLYRRRPDKQRHPDDGANHHLRFGVASTRGWRTDMENCHVTKPELDLNTSFFAIYDGHGGNDVAKFCETLLHERFTINEARHGNIEDAIKESYEEMDEMLRKGLGVGWSVEEYPEDVNENTGTTACVVILKDGKIMVANAGDSRCIIFFQDKVLFESVDHKTDVPEECERIIKAGGQIDKNGYLNGVLNTTRSIGDLELKDNDRLTTEQLVTATPDVKNLEAQEAYIVLACDGIWDVMTTSEVIEFINEHKDSEDRLSGICEKLIDKCVADKLNSEGLGCDNMSVIIVEMKNPLDQEMANVLAPVVPSMQSLIDYYTSRCSLVVAYEIVEKLESRYLFAKEMCADDVQAKIDSVMGSNDNRFIVPSTSDELFIFDEDLLQVCRLRGKSYKCSRDRGKVIARILNIVKGNLEIGKMISSRGLYYQDVALFRKQRIVDDDIILISLMLEVSRSSLNIYGSSRGLIKGPITLEGPDFKVDCESGGIIGSIIPVEAPKICGITVKPDIAKINFILVVEKEAVFMELSGLGIPRKLGCIIVTGRGEPDMSTRAVLSKLQKFLVDVPIYALVDPNSYGIGIYCTYRFGSKRMAHDNLGYSVPDLQWIGVYPSHLENVMKGGPLIKVTQEDIKKTKGLLAKDQISNDPLLKGELTWIMVNKIKGDIECCSHLGSDFIRDYLVSTIAGLMDITKEPEQLIKCFKQLEVNET